MAEKMVKELSNTYLNKKFLKYGFSVDVDGDNYYSLEFKNVPVPVINAITRISISELETFAFDVKVLTNTSQYNSEVLQHRLSSLTLNVAEASKLNALSKFLINVKESDKDRPFEYIFAHQIIKLEGNPEYKIEKLLPFNELLFSVKGKEVISLELTLTRGTGLEHARFTSGHTCFKFKSPNDEGDLMSDNVDQRNYYKNDKGEPEKILLTIKSFQKYTAKEMYKQSLNVIISKLENIKNEDYLISKSDSMLKFKFTYESHTLGYILEKFFLMYLLSDFPDNIREIASFYLKPYPTEDYIEYTLKIIPGKTTPSAIEYFYQGIDKIIRFVSNLNI